MFINYFLSPGFTETTPAFLSQNKTYQHFIAGLLNVYVNLSMRLKLD